MKKFLTTYWLPITIIALFIIGEVLGMRGNPVPSWDASVYVGMGKYLFSHGTIGTWESLRPVGLPVILGAFWKLGINPYTVGDIFGLLTGIGALILTYLFAERIKKGTGSIAMVLLASCGIFFMYSALPLTDVTSTFFAVWALYVSYDAVKNRDYFLAGLLVALAFMFRFPQGLMLVIIAIILLFQLFQTKGKFNRRFTIFIKRGLLVLAGFFVIVLPYLITNIHFYGNALTPFIEGTNSIKGYASLYDLGFWYYFTQLFKQDALLVIALLPIGLLWKKIYRNKTVMVVLLALFIFAAYFIYQPHKEIRYALAFLPYVVILAAVGIGYILEWFKVSPLLFFGLFVIVGFMINAGTLLYGTSDPNAPTFYAFDTYLDQAPGARIMSATPYTFAYSDTLLTYNLYGDWNNAYLDYNAYRSTNDYIALDSCNLKLGCADDGATCKDDKVPLLTELQQQDTRVFYAVTPVSKCALSIYKINH